MQCVRSYAKVMQVPFAGVYNSSNDHVTIELIVLQNAAGTVCARSEWNVIARKRNSSYCVRLLNASRFMNASIVESARVHEEKKRRRRRNIVFIANISRQVVRCTEDCLVSNNDAVTIVAVSAPRNGRGIRSCGQSFFQGDRYLATIVKIFAKFSR